MRFADIPGHQGVKERLTALVDNNRLPHAILLEGKQGIGKFMLARALAQYIHCTNRHDGDSCGVCPSCRLHQSLNHIDLCFSFPTVKQTGKSRNPVSDDLLGEFVEFIGKSPYMSFETWLTMLGNENAKPIIYVDESNSLIRKLNFSSHNSQYKIVLMWMADRMNVECANKLLKLIEEPPSDSVFIMTTDRPAEILPTIYSRLQRIDVSPLPEDVVAEQLMRTTDLTPDRAAQAAHLSGGSVTNALNKAAVAGDEAEMFDKFTQLMRLAYQRHIYELRAWADDVAKSGREAVIRFLKYCERMTEQNFIYNLNDARLVYLTDGEERFSRNFARFITERNVEKLRDIFIEGRIDVMGNANARIVMFDIAVKVILLLKHD